MPANSPATPPYPWRFYRAGGVDQVKLDKGDDIFALDQLDQKLWVALSCPVSGLEFDSRTLEMLDVDKDGHVRPPEILDAVRFLRKVLKSGDCLLEANPGFRLADLRSDTEEGRAILASAKHVLESLGKADAQMLTIEDATRNAEFFALARLNGDGVVPPSTMTDEVARATALEVIACIGSRKDRSGLDGVDQPSVDRFFAECEAFDAWSKGSEGTDANSARVMPFGAATPAAFAAMDAVRGKIDDYFARCRLAAFDARALAALNREEAAYLEVAAKDFSITAQEVAHFPLAMIAAGKPLPLDRDLNPAWSGAMATFRSQCAQGRNSLTEGEWAELRCKLDPYREWLAAKKGTAVESLGLGRVRTILASRARSALAQAIAADAAVAPEINAIQQCERLARMCRDFAKLLNNYVSFTDFYARRGAMFQAGTLYLDGRSCDLCFRVQEPAKHSTLAGMARTYLAYVECSRPNGAKMTVACAFTSGSSDNLFTGRNGIFYDRKGQDWNATITKVIDNPISIGQSFWSPYKKVIRFIEESVAKRAAAADATDKIQTSALDAVTGAADPKQKPKIDVGMVAAIGVALGSLATAVSSFLAAFFGLGAWIPLGLAGIVLAISGPSMLIAWLKLRQRNLGPILDANGWAVNTLTKVNIPLGTSLTSLPSLPKGATRSLVDPFAPKTSPWPFLFAVLAVLLVLTLSGYRFNVWHRMAPSYVPEFVTGGFEGPEAAIVGTESVAIRLTSGAKSVVVQGLEGVTRLDVDPKTQLVVVPIAKAPVGAKITLIDTTAERSQTHDIQIVKKP